MQSTAQAQPWKEKGWLLPYLLGLDPMLTAGRNEWWFSCDGIPEGPIPQIRFRSPSDDSVAEDHRDLPHKGKEPLTPAGACDHLRRMITQMYESGWSGLRFFMEWLAFGLGLEAEPPRGQPEKTEEMLYREFDLGILMAARADVFGRLYSENTGKGVWNPNAFYPTPHTVVEAMVNMVMHDIGDAKTKSVCDPCVGTGRMLMHASNYSVNLWGMDIDRLCVMATRINAAMFFPWAVWPKVDRGMPSAEEVSKLREDQGHPPLPAKFKANKQGQLTLFEEV